MTADHAPGAGPLSGRPKAYRFDQMPLELLKPGLSRTGIRSDGSLVTVNWFEPGFRSSGQHSHPFDQLSFVLSGTLEFFVGEDVYVLEAPAVLHIPGDVPHGAQPVGDERVLNIDVFAPVRDDFRALTAYQDAERADRTPSLQPRQERE
ncbi:cupin domain-containing protein [Pseudonocardia sp. WMMC193]|uniref:cupin domain-containing protein n=1 Tax=Pseudonocardia sp. WMMC193 TaxID=2911965 RepID=UPI001F28D2CC|nr:cupin domain-containing protein [Pseudonocardia sp. WMMC193]MCF7547923.1 cupin domain-containing protein [Pseudonocardia sp. WMMC193]